MWPEGTPIINLETGDYSVQDICAPYHTRGAAEGGSILKDGARLFSIMHPCHGLPVFPSQSWPKTIITGEEGSLEARSGAHFSIHRRTPRPCGCGSVMWCASQVQLPPRNSAKIGAPRACACSSSSNTSTPAGLAGSEWLGSSGKSRVPCRPEQTLLAPAHAPAPPEPACLRG